MEYPRDYLLSTIVLLLACSGSTLGRDLLPERWFENVAASDGSTQRSLVFRTVAGVGYRVESSSDLVSWQTELDFYGMGHEFVIPMCENAPPPPPEPGEELPPAMPPATHVSLQLQPSSSSEGGTVVSWKSLNHGGPLVFRIAGSMHPDWDTVPLFAERYGNHYFFVTHPSLPAAPPLENPTLGSLDAAMIVALEANLAAMNDAVSTSAERARNTPPPAPPSADAQRFWRIRADWSFDTDSDGNFDWEEFELQANSTHSSHAFGQAFNGDTDSDGVPDGSQADNDEDGIPNDIDADRGNGAVDWQRTGEPRFAWFQITPPADPWDGEQQPIQTTDRGHVVFPYGLWSAGDYTEVLRSSARTAHCRILAMNSFFWEHLVGAGFYDRNDDGHPEQGCMVWWVDGSPLPIRSGDFFATFPFPDFPSNGQFLGSDGGFVGGVYNQTLDPELVRWTLPALPSESEASFGEVEQWVNSGISSDLLWGGNQAKIGALTTTLPGTYQRMTVTPGNSVLAFSNSNRPALLRSGSWAIEKTFDSLVDFSASGFGISATPVAVWNNGRVLPLAKVAPGLAESWRTGARFIDLSNAGNLLVARHSSPSESADAFGLAVPVVLEDTEAATGVDFTSVASTEPGPGIDDKLWIMAPMGGENVVRFRTTASADTCALELSATGVTFEPASLTSTSEEVTISGEGAESADVTLTFTNGAAVSLSQPVGVKVMRNRTVRVSVYPVTLNLFGEDGLVYPPQFNLTEEVLEEALDRVFEGQVAAKFDVHLENTILTNWDVNGDLIFQADAPEGELTPEQEHIVGIAPDTTFSPHLKVFVIGGPPPADLPQNPARP